jgi:flagellar basal body-associated protein FliL
MGFIKILIIIICVLWLIKVIVRLALPILFQSIVKKAQDHANQQYQQQYKKPDGKITVDYIPPRDNDKGSSGGEFVDYEEIK